MTFNFNQKKKVLTVSLLFKLFKIQNGFKQTLMENNKKVLLEKKFIISAV